MQYSKALLETGNWWKFVFPTPMNQAIYKAFKLYPHDQYMVKGNHGYLTYMVRDEELVMTLRLLSDATCYRGPWVVKPKKSYIARAS